MLKGNEGRSLTCAGCGREVWPRVGSYWFLLLSPRGRCRFPGVEEVRAVLCGPCGRRAQQALESSGIGGVFRVSGNRQEDSDREAFERGVVLD